MKIALNYQRPGLTAFAISGLVLAGLSFYAPRAVAQITSAAPGTPPVAAIPSAPVAPSSAATTPASAASDMANAPPPPVSSPADTTIPATAPSLPDEKSGKGLSASEDKVTDSVKSIAKRLGSTDSVTLDDLNSAHQAVAKIEALIDVEKHLSELDKLRSEREGSHFMAPPMPASALGTMPAMQAMPMPAATLPVAPVAMPSLNNIDVLRIIGSDGRYSALVKAPDGPAKLVDVGDKVDGATITLINASGVELDRNGTKHTVPIKRMQTVSNGSTNSTMPY